MREFYEALSTGKTLREFVGSDPKFTVDTEQAEALQRYILWGRDLIENQDNGLKARLNDFLNRPYDKKKPDGPTHADLLLEGHDLAGINRGRALSIVEQSSRCSVQSGPDPNRCAGLPPLVQPGSQNWRPTSTRKTWQSSLA